MRVKERCECACDAGGTMDSITDLSTAKLPPGHGRRHDPSPKRGQPESQHNAHPSKGEMQPLQWPDHPTPFYLTPQCAGSGKGDHDTNTKSTLAMGASFSSAQFPDAARRRLGRQNTRGRAREGLERNARGSRERGGEARRGRGEEEREKAGGARGGDVVAGLRLRSAESPCSLRGSAACR